MKTSFFTAVSAVALAASGVQAFAAANDHPLAGKALAIASAASGKPLVQLQVGQAATVGDGNLVRFKVLDAQGTVRAVNLDKNGNQVSNTLVTDALEAASDGDFVGKFERELAARLGQRDAGPVDVVFQLRGPPAGAGGRGDLRGLQRAMAEAQNGLVRALEQGNQARIKHRAQYAPLVVVSGNAASVQAAAARTDVQRVYLERVHEPRLSVTKVVTQATTVHGRSINGTGVRVGVVEASRIGTHTNLPSAQRILCRPESTTLVSNHKTEVAGVIQSRNTTHTGQAYAVTIVDGIGADFSDAEMMAATDCVINQGAVAINMSFGSDTNGVFDALSRYVDATVYNTGRTIVVAVSNNCSALMGSPEIAFNDLSVGSFSDRNTTGFSDDVHSCNSAISPRHSAFLDPPSPSNDREQPDLVAPGHAINTTFPGGTFASVPGTSFAAPHVTGLAALLEDRTTVFSGQSERLRAIIMASARHNIEGASRLSEQDGAGATMDAAADRVLLNNQSWFFTTRGGTAGFPRNQTFAATAGQKVRVAVVWAHKDPAGASLTRPTTDLDLAILNPSGTSVTSSASFDNNFEIVEFTASVTGTYTARINNFAPSNGAEYIGLAVSRTDT